MDTNGIPNSGDFVNPVCIPVAALPVERRMETLERLKNVAMEAHTCCHRWYRMVGFTSSRGFLMCSPIKWLDLD